MLVSQVREQESYEKKTLFFGPFFMGFGRHFQLFREKITRKSV